ncbi:hypothetical protein KP509_21G082300 [Ceratopteris richardii]|uniref:Small ribosomal subunit protein uS10 n=1 Tax=Ceratopteris richardii TaxID=49495 RepID=A0A8T2SFN4_CERRI|nr:hypothetical protein KP509_21G082300 [Ceratopteris richardii]
MNRTTGKRSFLKAPPPPDAHEMRFTLISTNLKSIEKVCAYLIKCAKARQIKVKGPVRLPTKTLRLTTRRSPCGQGRCSWDKFELHLHKRIVDIQTSFQDIKRITSITIDTGIDIEVTLLDK